MTLVAQALKEFLLEHTVSEIDTASSTSINQQRQNGIIELDSTLEPVEAAKILWTNNIIGAPVKDHKAQKYIGFFEMRDILSTVIATALSENEEGDDGGSGINLDRYKNEHMVKELPDSLTNCDNRKYYADASPSNKTISYLAVRNSFSYCKTDATLFDLGECLSKKNCHRVPILDEEGKCHKIVSQSALIKFIALNCQHDQLEVTIQDAQIPYKKNVVSIIDTATASEAFKLLDSKRLSGIAVVDAEDGKLIGNTSARDIKLAAIDEGKIAMDMDILSYLAKVRQAVPQKKERYPSCHVHEDATVAHVIDLIAKTGYHRVFVVDENICPIGVISVTDIIKYAVNL